MDSPLRFRVTHVSRGGQQHAKPLYLDRVKHTRRHGAVQMSLEVHGRMRSGREF